MAGVLIIDDDLEICLFFTRLMKQMGHTCITVNTVADGLEQSRSGMFDLILLDLELSDGNGLEILPALTKVSSRPEVIIITGTGDIGGAETAFKYGAWDYIQKPFLLEEVSLPITRALQYRKEKQTRHPASLIRSRIIGESPALLKCLEEVATAAATDAGVLISGETGTGKELCARAIHENSKRASRPFVAVDCGALPESLVESTLFGHEKGAFTGAGKKQPGLIAQAHGGTLMLDEVGDLPLSVQNSLLRTLQERRVRPVGGISEKQVDFRLISATNLNLEQMVKENRFREELLFRLRAMEIKIPPLREREKDIEEITIKKVHELAKRYGMETKAVSPDFLQVIMLHNWPGNVRELINVIEYALASAGGDPTLFPKHLPPKYRTAPLTFDASEAEHPMYPPPPRGNHNDNEFPTLQAYRTENEKNYLSMLLEKSRGDREQASRISGISQSRLYTLLKKHNLSGFSSHKK